MNMSLLIPLLFLVVITLFILFFKKNRKRFRPKDDKIATPSKEEINLLLTTRISYDFELPGGFSDIVKLFIWNRPIIRSLTLISKLI